MLRAQFNKSVSSLTTISLCILLFGCTNNKISDDLSIFESMVLIPSGTFTMGGKSESAYRNEFPRHEVSVSSFYMDITEVTNRQFNQFVSATGYITTAEKNIDWETMKEQVPLGTMKPPDSVLQAGSLVFKQTNQGVNLNDFSQWWEWTVGANWRTPHGPGSSIKSIMSHPVIHISLEDALAYAKWADKRLPTEAEWEWAAMGGIQDAIYPWGNQSVEKAADKANLWQGSFPSNNSELDGFYGTSPVMSFPKNGYGLYDLAGNVWEWCSDKYDERYFQNEKNTGSSINPKGSNDYFDPTEPYVEKHILRGGSYLCNEVYCSGYRVARRMSADKTSSYNHTGFRCVKDVEKSI